jgi:pSer/pThr/pTyr-binding forkhead associated (FHA) protein
MPFELVYRGRLDSERFSPSVATGPQPELKDGAAFVLPSGGRLLIGRLPTCEIWVQSNRVSKVHALVSLMYGDDRNDERLIVADLNTTNGTWVEGQRGRVFLIAPDRELLVANLFRFIFRKA